MIQRLPQFKELTGIDVKYELTPEENYFDKITTQLSGGNWRAGCLHDRRRTKCGTTRAPSASSPWTNYLGDASATNPDYNAKDIFEGVFNAGKWDLKPGSPPGSGSLWCVPLGFELYCLAYNKKYFDERGLEGSDHPG